MAELPHKTFAFGFELMWSICCSLGKFWSVNSIEIKHYVMKLYTEELIHKNIIFVHYEHQLKESVRRGETIYGSLFIYRISLK